MYGKLRPARFNGPGLLPLSLTAALLAGCAAREPAAPSFGSSPAPYSYAWPSLPVQPWAASAEREAYGLPDTDDAAKAAPRRAARKRHPANVAVNPPPISPRPVSPPDPGNCAGWWRVCRFL
jgi:hypothetical protein